MSSRTDRLWGFVIDRRAHAPQPDAFRIFAGPQRILAASYDECTNEEWSADSCLEDPRDVVLVLMDGPRMADELGLDSTELREGSR
ncbi:hypothetical protein RB195_012377 [Necator americanus]|uniref:Uncharacterized protein n=1 Tax=Necator americanus TaxID=51031 RepID=A0ABR1D8M0_NECAM